MKKLLKIYLQKPELAGVVLLAVMIGLFQVRSQMIFLSAENIRGVLGVLPEVGLVAIGVTLLYIAATGKWNCISQAMMCLSSKSASSGSRMGA